MGETSSEKLKISPSISLLKSWEVLTMLILATTMIFLCMGLLIFVKNEVIEILSELENGIVEFDIESQKVWQSIQELNIDPAKFRERRQTYVNSDEYASNSSPPKAKPMDVIDMPKPSTENLIEAIINDLEYQPMPVKAPKIMFGPDGGPLPEAKPPGIQVNDKCNCAKENKCPAGPPGPKGVPGPRGDDGLPGFDGIPGVDAESAFEQVQQYDQCFYCPSGPMGMPGLTGRPGMRGMRGARGSAGMPGRHGSPGSPGVQGPEGPNGPDGPQGEPGTKGQDGTAKTGVKGPKGEQGPPGPPGNPGSPGPSGLKGPIGEVGEIGEPGEPGMEGAEGMAGEAGPEGEPGADAEYCPCPRRFRLASKFYRYVGL